MGSEPSSQVVYYVPTTGQGGASGNADGSSCSGGSCGGSGSASDIVTPAVAKSIAGDTARAQQAQVQERQRAYGISSTYNRFKNRGTESGNSTLGGN